MGFVNAFWNTISEEHKLAEDGKFIANKDDVQDPRRLNKIDIYYTMCSTSRFKTK